MFKKGRVERTAYSVEVGGQFVGVYSLLLPRGPQKTNSGHRPFMTDIFIC